MLSNRAFFHVVVMPSNTNPVDIISAEHVKQIQNQFVEKYKSVNRKISKLILMASSHLYYKRQQLKILFMSGKHILFVVLRFLCFHCYEIDKSRCNARNILFPIRKYTRIEKNYSHDIVVSLGSFSCEKWLFCHFPFCCT